MDVAEKIEEQIQMLFGVLPESFWTATAVVLIAFAVFAAAATVVLLILLFSADENFFIRLIEKEEQPFRLTVFSVVKNGFGLFLLIAGILMLVLPGQGILTVLIFSHRKKPSRRSTAFAENSEKNRLISGKVFKKNAGFDRLNEN